MNDEAERLLSVDPQAAFEIASKAVAIAERMLPAGETRARSLFLKGTALAYQAAFVDAQTVLKAALTASQSLNQPELTVRCQNGIAVIYERLGDFGQAFSALHACLQSAREIKDATGQVRALTNIASVYQTLQEYDKALDAATEALLLSKDVHDIMLTAVSAVNVGEALLARGDTQAAEPYLDQARHAALEGGLTIHVGYIDALKARVHLQEGRLDLALGLAAQVEAVARSTNERDMLLDVLITGGEAALALGETEDASSKVTEAVAVGETLSIPVHLERAYDLAARVAAAQRNFELAYRQALKHHTFALQSAQERGNRTTAVQSAEFEVARHRRVAEEERQRNQALESLNSRLQETLAQVNFHASHDSLTGLLNRRRFIEALEEHLQLISGQNLQAAVCFVDLDDFKKVNDTLGHDIGDELLQHVADRLKARVRREDLVARIGGDEFIVLFTQMGNPDDFSDRIQSLADVFDDPVVIAGKRLRVDASIGMAIFPRDGTTVEDLQRNADHAMYEQKRLRKSGVPGAVPFASSSQILAEALQVAQIATWHYDLAHDRIEWIGSIEGLFDDGRRRLGTAARAENFVHPDDRSVRQDHLRRARQSGTPYSLEHRVVTNDGSVRWVSARGAYHRDAKGKVVAMTGAMIDITDRRLADEQRFAAARELETVLDCIPLLISIRDAGDRVVTANRVFRKAFGISASEAGRIGAYQPQGPQDKDGWQPALAKGIGENSFPISCRRISLPGGRYLDLARDEREPGSWVEEGRYVSIHDPLTGLPNREALLASLREFLAKGAGDDGLTVLLIGLQGLNLIREGLGHAAADAVVQTVGRRLLERCLETEQVAKIGDDSFVLVSPSQGPIGEERAADIARALILDLGAAVTVNGVNVAVSLYAGGAFFPGHGDTAEELLKNVTAAAYRAQERDSGVAIYDPSFNASAPQSVQRLHELSQALAHGELEIYMQPKVELGSGRIVGAEALLRWNHPSGEQVPPDQFIPLAETTGLIVPIGLWVLRESCVWAARWIHRIDGFRLCVNVSPRQLFEPGFVDEAVAIIRESGMAPEQVEMEITETSMVRAPVEAAVLMTKLRHAGLQIALDDFGTGYSSLAHVRTFPITTLKIDRSFTANCTVNPHDAAVVTAILALADGMQIEAIAEGVETQEQAQMLIDAGCRVAQGFLYSRARPLAEADALLERNISQP